MTDPHHPAQEPCARLMGFLWRMHCWHYDTDKSVDLRPPWCLVPRVRNVYRHRCCRCPAKTEWRESTYAD